MLVPALGLQGGQGGGPAEPRGGLSQERGDVPLCHPVPLGRREQGSHPGPGRAAGESASGTKQHTGVQSDLEKNQHPGLRGSNVCVCVTVSSAPTYAVSIQQLLRWLWRWWSRWGACGMEATTQGGPWTPELSS